jgi:hypothetical protein
MTVILRAGAPSIDEYRNPRLIEISDRKFPGESEYPRARVDKADRGEAPAENGPGVGTPGAIIGVL